ncbi:hypothetical protein [Streptomyces sp. ME19-01-6]|nr:hypothetical protein [Streptomyces sp. ME19-01-6]
MLTAEQEEGEPDAAKAGRRESARSGAGHTVIAPDPAGVTP